MLQHFYLCTISSWEKKLLILIKAHEQARDHSWNLTVMVAVIGGWRRHRPIPALRSDSGYAAPPLQQPQHETVVVT